MRLPFLRRGPGPDASYALLPRAGVAYGRIPKVADLLIRRRMTSASRGNRGGSPDRDPTSRDAPSQDAPLVTGRQLRRQRPDAYVFTVVRSPFERLVWCWRNKVLGGVPELGPPFVADMSLEAFVLTAARIRDRGADLHLRSQVSLLFAGGEPPSLDVFRYETLAADWDRLAAAWAKRGLELGAPRESSEREPEPWTAAAVAAARRRYAEDFARFYPDLPDPG